MTIYTVIFIVALVFFAFAALSTAALVAMIWLGTHIKKEAKK